MDVRPATTDDVPGIRDVARETWHAAYDDIIGPAGVDEQIDEWYTRESVASGVTREDWAYVVAEYDGEVGGFATGGPTEDGPTDGVVAAIYVRPAHWSEGTGSALLTTIHDRLRDMGCDSVSLAVLAENDVGRSFYDDHGYAVHGERETEVGGVATGELLLRRDLG